jgi:YfiH family protein
MTWQILPHDGSGLPLARSGALDALGFVRHGVTVGGSTCPDLNLSYATAADPESVGATRSLACRGLGFDPSRLVMPNQVHGADVLVATEASPPAGATPSVDALVTSAPGALLGITVADCLPILIVDTAHRAVGLAHSGWRGTAAGVALRTLETMRKAFGTEAEECVVAIGPGIGPEGYEVDAPVYEAFPAVLRQAPGVFAPTRPGHFALDLIAAVREQLLTSGVQEPRIDIAPWRTNRDRGLFFSHRLAPGCPRMGAFLGLTT